MNPHSESMCPPHRIGTRIMLSIVWYLALVTGLPALAGDDPKLESNLQRLSYMLGFRLGQSLRRAGQDEVDAAALAMALDDVFEQRSPRLTPGQMRAAQAEFQARRAAQQARGGGGQSRRGPGIPCIERE